jgi:hypothetical protein
MRTKGIQLLPRLRRRHCVDCGKPAKQLYCDTCGHKHVERMRSETLKSHQHGW